MQSLKILLGLSLVIDMRLIDADALKDAIMQEVYKDRVGVFVARRIFKLIDNAPTVEAYPFEQVQELVKLNQQFAQEIENLKRPQGDLISCCKGNFCPDCGADMRGGTE